MFSSQLIQVIIMYAREQVYQSNLKKQSRKMKSVCWDSSSGTSANIVKRGICDNFQCWCVCQTNYRVVKVVIKVNCSVSSFAKQENWIVYLQIRITKDCQSRWNSTKQEEGLWLKGKGFALNLQRWRRWRKEQKKKRKGGSGVEFKKVVVLVAEVSESVKCN